MIYTECAHISPQEPTLPVSEYCSPLLPFTVQQTHTSCDVCERACVAKLIINSIYFCVCCYYCWYNKLDPRYALRDFSFLTNIQIHVCNWLCVIFYTQQHNFFSTVTIKLICMIWFLTESSLFMCSLPMWRYIAVKFNFTDLDRRNSAILTNRL